MIKILDRDFFQEILEALLRNKSRSLLTGFGVFWGIFMLLFMIGGGQGVKALVAKELDGFATNSGFVVPARTSIAYKGFKKERSWRMTTQDIESIQKNVPEVDVISGVLSMWDSKVTYEEREADCSGKGVHPDYAAIDSPTIRYGRYINEIDIKQERKVCVIGKSIYNDLFPEGGDPCGKYVKMGDVYYEVVGVDYHTGAININGRSEESVTIPISVLQKVYNRGNRVDFICLTAKPGCSIKDVLVKVRGILSKQHLFSPEDKKAVMEINAEELFQIMDKLFGGLNLLIWLVGFGTLLAAAIGVSNIMMVTVRERTTEIGIRRAIGATPNMILSQIMSESIILTIVSGMMGILVSVAGLSVAETIAKASSDMTYVGFQISFQMAMLALFILIVLGVVAGLAPARRALEIKPVDAMRDE